MDMNNLAAKVGVMGPITATGLRCFASRVGCLLEKQNLPEPCIVCGKELSKYGKMWKVSFARLPVYRYHIRGPYCAECGATKEDNQGGH